MPIMDIAVDGSHPPEVLDHVPLDLFEADNRMINAVRKGLYIFGGEMLGVSIVEIESTTPAKVDNLMLVASANFLIAVASTAAIYTFTELRAR